MQPKITALIIVQHSLARLTNNLAQQVFEGLHTWAETYYFAILVKPRIIGARDRGVKEKFTEFNTPNNEISYHVRATHKQLTNSGRDRERP